IHSRKVSKRSIAVMFSGVRLANPKTSRPTIAIASTSSGLICLRMSVICFLGGQMLSEPPNGLDECGVERPAASDLGGLDHDVGNEGADDSPLPVQRPA